MLKSLLIVSIFLITFSSCAQEKNCSDFKTGEFIYLDENRPEKIIRTKDKQIEKNKENGIEIHTTIQWETDCKYILTYEKILNYPYDVTDIIGEKIYVEILEINENKIKVHAKSSVTDEDIEFMKIK